MIRDAFQAAHRQTAPAKRISRPFSDACHLLGFDFFGENPNFPRVHFPLKKILAILLPVGGVVAKLVRRWSRKPEIQSSTLCNARFPAIYFFSPSQGRPTSSAARLAAGHSEEIVSLKFLTKK